MGLSIPCSMKGKLILFNVLFILWNCVVMFAQFEWNTANFKLHVYHAFVLFFYIMFKTEPFARKRIASKFPSQQVSILWIWDSTSYVISWARRPVKHAICCSFLYGPDLVPVLWHSWRSCWKWNATVNPNFLSLPTSSASSICSSVFKPGYFFNCIYQHMSLPDTLRGFQFTSVHKFYFLWTLVNPVTIVFPWIGIKMGRKSESCC